MPRADRPGSENTLALPPPPPPAAAAAVAGSGRGEADHEGRARVADGGEQQQRGPASVVVRFCGDNSPWNGVGRGRQLEHGVGGDAAAEGAAVERTGEDLERGGAEDAGDRLGGDVSGDVAK